MVEIKLSGMCAGCSVADIRLETLERNDGTTFFSARCYHEAACEEIRRITELRTANKIGKWIPIRERKPDRYQKCMVCDISGKIAVGVYTAPAWTFPHYFEDVIAWMPLPDPYGAGSEV